jgi:hypothetical protein
MIIAALSLPRARLCGCSMTSAEMRMIRVLIPKHNYARPAMPCPRTAGLSAMRFYVTAEMPPIAPRLQHYPSHRRAALFPRTIRCNRRRSGFRQQSECSIPRTATYHPAKAIACLKRSRSRRQNLALMHPFCHRPPSILIPHTAHGDHCYPMTLQGVRWSHSRNGAEQPTSERPSATTVQFVYQHLPSSSSLHEHHSSLDLWERRSQTNRRPSRPHSLSLPTPLADSYSSFQTLDKDDQF